MIAVDELDHLGLSLDFTEVKQQLKRWLDEHWDHAFLVNDADLVLVNALRQIPESKLYLFAGRNPSTEVMAQELFAVAQARFGDAIQAVRIWESTRQYAEYRPGGTSSAGGLVAGWARGTGLAR
jgi:6-pyruvoyltetrahydropterin/6-carboxytetrahydropterin synthase